MNGGIHWQAAARREFAEAISWYKEKDSELGLRFVLELDALLSAITTNPLHFPPVTMTSRKARLPGWPYLV